MVHVFKVAESYTNITGPNRDAFLAQLWELRENTEDDISIDLEGVEHLGSLALAAIGKLHNWLEEHDRHLIVRCPNVQIYEVFKITGFAQALDLVDTPSE